MRRVTSLLSTAALVVGVSGVAFTPSVAAAPVPASGSSAQPASVADELLVGYAAGTSASDRASARSRAGSRLVSVVVPEAAGRAVVELVATPAGGRGQAERRFEADPKVAYAEPNWIYQHAAVSNDTSYLDGTLWGMYGDATTPANQYGSQAGEAWAAGSTGSSTVYVGVIDEGIQITHPDLNDNIWLNQYDPKDGRDNDGNGYVDDINGWDFDGNNATVYDGTGDDHGTHVAGTIGAEGANGIGVAGVVWDVTLIPLKFLGSRGGTTDNAIRAVNYLTDLKTRHGMNVVASNNSWGGGGYSQGLYDAIQAADAANILFIAAAGNGGSDSVGDDNDATPRYPSSYAHNNVIAVAAIDKYGAKTSWSNFGATSVDLGAPGAAINSTLPDNKYGSYGGTSMATPHVSGAAALYAVANAGASAAAIKDAIMNSTVPTTSLSGKTVTGGRLNVSGFTSTAAVNTPPAAPGAPIATPGDSVVGLDWPDNIDTDLAGYEVWRASDSSAAARITTVLLTNSAYQDTAVVNGTAYTYHVVAVDTGNLPSPNSPPATATPTASSASAPFVLSATWSKVGPNNKVALVWSGTSAANVDILRNSKKLTAIANSGSYEDNLKRQTGSFTYQVCAAGTTTCSNEVKVDVG